MPYTAVRTWEKEEVEGNYCGFSGEMAKQEAPGGHGGRDAQKAARPGEVRREIWSREGICV